MAFVVEDGTGKPDANSYASVAGANVYFSERGISAWTGTDELKQTWLIQATDYIELRFGPYFKSERQFTSDPVQALSFPRIDYGMPPALIKATYEYAFRAINGPLAPDITLENGFAVKSFTKKIGPLTKQYDYETGSKQAVFKTYPAVDSLLSPFIGNVNNGRVIRS